MCGIVKKRRNERMDEKKYWPAHCSQCLYYTEELLGAGKLKGTWRNGDCPLDSISVKTECADTAKQFKMYWDKDAHFRQTIRDILKARGETEEDLWRGLGVRPDDF